jgi:hypothetical protein
MSFFTTKERFSESLINQEVLFTSNVNRLNNMLDVCYEKCMRVSNESLTRGEALCIDRCSQKFFKLAEMIEEISKKKMLERQQQNVDSQ